MDDYDNITNTKLAYAKGLAIFASGVALMFFCGFSALPMWLAVTCGVLLTAGLFISVATEKYSGIFQALALFCIGCMFVFRGNAGSDHDLQAIGMVIAGVAAFIGFFSARADIY